MIYALLKIAKSVCYTLFKNKLRGNRMLKIAILDDNTQHLEQNKKYVEACLKEEKLYASIETFNDISILYEKVNHGEIDYQLMLLDIQFDNKLNNGIKLGERVNQEYPNTQLIFITAFTDYIEDVYRCEHIYTIYKPVKYKLLSDALKKAIKRLQKLEEECILVHNKDREYKISQLDILYIKHEKKYSYIYTTNEIIKTSCKIKDIFALCNQDDFILCHNRYIVSVHHIFEISYDWIVLKNDVSIPISRAYQKQVRNKFQKIGLKL